jgi:hypothetical protein
VYKDISSKGNPLLSNLERLSNLFPFVPSVLHIFKIKYIPDCSLVTLSGYTIILLIKPNLLSFVITLSLILNLQLHLMY